LCCLQSEVFGTKIKDNQEAPKGKKDTRDLHVSFGPPYDSMEDLDVERTSGTMGGMPCKHSRLEGDGLEVDPLHTVVKDLGEITQTCSGSLRRFVVENTAEFPAAFTALEESLSQECFLGLDDVPEHRCSIGGDKLEGDSLGRLMPNGTAGLPVTFSASKEPSEHLNVEKTAGVADDIPRKHCNFGSNVLEDDSLGRLMVQEQRSLGESPKLCVTKNLEQLLQVTSTTLEADVDIQSLVENEACMCVGQDQNDSDGGVLSSEDFPSEMSLWWSFPTLPVISAPGKITRCEGHEESVESKEDLLGEGAATNVLQETRGSAPKMTMTPRPRLRGATLAMLLSTQASRRALRSNSTTPINGRSFTPSKPASTSQSQPSRAQELINGKQGRDPPRAADRSRPHSACCARPGFGKAASIAPHTLADGKSLQLSFHSRRPSWRLLTRNEDHSGLVVVPEGRRPPRPLSASAACQRRNRSPIL